MSERNQLLAGIARLSFVVLMLAIVFLVAPGISATASGAATPAGERGALLPQDPSGIGVGMAFNYYVPELAAEIGTIDYVWGASSPAPTGVYNTAYVAFNRDDLLAGPHPLAWWQANHPTWIEYRCNKRKPAFEFDKQHVPLDFSNPAVQDYQWEEEIEPRLAEGYAGIAFDNLELSNGYSRCGHFDASHHWVQQYTGGRDDPAYTEAVLAWAAATETRIHAYSATATMSINYSYEPEVSASDNLQLMGDADLVFDERGMTNWGTAHVDRPTPGLWLQIYNAAISLQQAGSCYDLNNDVHVPSAEISTSDLEWAVSNYLLVKAGCTYISISGLRGRHGREQDYGSLLLYPQYSRPIGEPIGAAAEQPSGVYMRSFTGGLAVVNPTIATAAATLPPGSWYNGQGEQVTGLLSLPPQQGAILTSAP